MNRISWAGIVLFFLITAQHIDNQAQNFSKSIQITWLEPWLYEDEEGVKSESLLFSGSISDEEFPTLPCYYAHFPVDADYAGYEVALSDEQYEPVPREQVRLIPSDFARPSVSVRAETVYEKKRPWVGFSFIPLRKAAGGYERLTSATVTIRGRGVRKAEATRSYAAHSVLQSGNFYRITVPETGIYKVTYNDLTTLGASVSGLPSARIALFGNGGGMLAESNAVSRHDDLQEMPIEIHDGGDGTFDPGDYFVFYAEGPHSWSYNNVEQRFTHSFNLYTDKASYFVTVDAGVGEKLRVTEVDHSSLTATGSATTFTHYGFIEEDKLNLKEGGRVWLGDKFDATTTATYTLALPAPPTGAGRMTVAVATTSVRYSTFAVSLDGQTIGSVGLQPTSGGNYADQVTRDLNFSASAGSHNLQLTYSKPTSSSVGYLNYIEWQIECQLRAGNGAMPFCAPQTMVDAVTQFFLANATGDTKVWDVTEPHGTRQMHGTLTNGTFTFKSRTDTLRRFVAFTLADCRSVGLGSRVANQDLHGSSQVDMVIVAHPDFITEAERLADFRRSHDGLSVKIVTPQQIYNEYASGEQDVCAIRDYMRMIYDRSGGAQPRYLLLFGRPSYDYRGIEGTCKLYVPNFQCSSIANSEYFKANDDFFGLLDENEGANSTGKSIDIAIGRFPVSTASQAKIAVDKTIQYASSEILGANTQSCNFGDWKNVVTFVGDDEDHNAHITTADACAQRAENGNANLNCEKIYFDAYQQVTYSSSARYPEVTIDFNNRMNKGSLLFTYVGHGGKYGLAHERIIDLTDISRWSNRYNQPWFFTMTCEFGWCDRAMVSPAESAFLNSHGGASGLVSTYRVAYTGGNHNYITHLFENIFTPTDGPITLGEANRQGKNAGSGNCSDFNMIYVIGDPAMRLALPRYQVVTDSINGIAVAAFTDTLKALTRVRVSGHIEDANGNAINDFDGVLQPSIYDKKVKMHTLQNDPNSYYYEFDVQKNILFKGNTTVSGGRFQYTFILPKDINYAYGTGKFSHYAHSHNGEAAGAFSQAVIGGMSDDTFTDANGPEIQLYMNDEKFVNGGIVNPSPTLLVKLSDEYGINTTGNGIGHDLVATLDDGGQVVLNSYYEAERDSYNRGVVRYPYENLAPGTHKLKVRAWDILNNVSERELEFVVASEEGFVLNHVLNYPNPFTTHTSFFFEHNRPGQQLDVLITIYTISGKVVRTLEATQLGDGFRSDPIEWDGLDDFGDKIGKGTYIYRLRVRTADGEQAEKIEKLVIL